LKNRYSDLAPGRVQARARHLFVLAVLLVPGCGGGPAVEPVDTSLMPEMEATAADLVEGINSRADSIRGIRAEIDLGFRRARGENMTAYRGELVSLRGRSEADGSKIHLKGFRELDSTFFTLTSDGTGSWLYFPGRNIVFTGPYNRSETAGGADVDIEAADLAKALFVEPFHSADIAGLSEESGVYILTLIRDGGLRRRLWIDKRMFAVVMEKYYDPRGVEELELRRSKHTLAGGTHYPLDIAILDPVSGGETILSINGLILNPSGIPSETFQFVVPIGTDVERLE